MDFDQAIAAHSAWKSKLKAYFKNPDGSLKAADVEVDNKCALGQWIHGEGARFSSCAAYGTLKKEHDRFHKVAGALVRRADSGQSVAEDVALGGASEFTKATTVVVNAIVELKKGSSLIAAGLVGVILLIMRPGGGTLQRGEESQGRACW